ncbi:P-loop containing nucleoside triphosphate hydrolase protein [Trichophaea hybrida]|nr:P-loop containing nucleoside triphosphate hydrolase protein [Trichophaea hybrida]
MSKPLDHPIPKKRKIDSSKTPITKNTTTKDTKKRRSLQKPSESQLILTMENKDTVATAPLNAKTFEELHLPSTLLKSISGLGIFEPSPVQQQAIPALLSGSDVVAVSASERDAIISFLIPAVALLEKHRFHTRHGTGVLIVTPNRETAVQVSGLASELLSRTAYTVGMVIDGANWGAEEQKLDRGINLLIATPARLLDHIQDTTSFVFKNLKAFCVYEAGKFAGLGTDKQIREITTLIPKKDRISMVFGTEQTDELNGLAELVCQPDTVHRYNEVSTGSSDSKEQQGYVIVEADKRFLLLHSFLKKFQNKKIIVLMSSTPSIMFSSEAFNSLDIIVHSVHGRQNVKTRLAAFSGFVKDAGGTLLLTEEAVEGLEIPPVDWVIQYDPPWSIKQFIKRRGAIRGQSVAFVQPGESGFVDQLKAANIEVKEFDFPPKKLINIQTQIEKLVSKNFGLHQLAKDGFRPRVS